MNVQDAGLDILRAALMESRQQQAANARAADAVAFAAESAPRTALLVSDWMSTPVQVVHENTPVGDAYNLMMRRGIRRLPVVDGNHLVGIVTLGDLREARPSPAASLSLYELNYLLSKLTVGQVMTQQPYTVMPDTPVIQAARIMMVRKLSGLPVVNGLGDVVGIITESDIFRMLIDQWDNFTGADRQNALEAALS